MSKDLRKLIVDYLDEQKLMQLCTVNNGNPWACSVWQASDQDLNIYFFSSTTRRHSAEIDKDPRVAGALALPHEVGGEARGLQFEGKAEILLANDQVAEARRHYQDRIFDAKTIDDLMNNEQKPHKFYKINPSKFVLFDTLNFPEESRQEYEL